MCIPVILLVANVDITSVIKTCMSNYLASDKKELTGIYAQQVEGWIEEIGNSAFYYSNLFLSISVLH